MQWKKTQEQIELLHRWHKPCSFFIHHVKVDFSPSSSRREAQ